MLTSVRQRLVAVLTLILVAAFFVIILLNYSSTKQNLTREIRQSSLPLLRDNIYSEIQQEFLPLINTSSMMATDSFVRNWALQGEVQPEQIVQYLGEIRRRYGFESVFFVSEQTRNYYHYQGILKQIDPGDDHDVWFFSFVERGKEFELDVDTDQAAEGRLTIFINYRVSDFEEGLLGVTGVGIEIDGLTEFFRERQERYKRRIYLVDHDGTVQVHSDPGQIERRNIRTTDGIAEIADNLLRTEKVPLDATYESSHGTVLISSRYIPEIDWFLIVEQDQETLMASTRSNLIRTVIVGLVATLLIILLSALAVSYYHKQLEELATTDSLTGCANRREFTQRTERMIYRFNRYGTPLSMIMLDIDHFKRLNDTHGHQAGDKLLKLLTGTIEDSKRPDDLLARWGGDEFLIVVEAEADQARILAERLRYAFSLKIDGSEKDTFRVTLSMGIVQLEQNEGVEELVGRADKALYRAKRAGRDKIIQL